MRSNREYDICEIQSYLGSGIPIVSFLPAEPLASDGRANLKSFGWAPIRLALRGKLLLFAPQAQRDCQLGITSIQQWFLIYHEESRSIG
jgi:hypothetical protein